MTAWLISATLNRQPQQRRILYEDLAREPEGRSVRQLLDDVAISEPDLRQTLRKLEAAGLAHRSKGKWIAVPLDS